MNNYSFSNEFIEQSIIRFSENIPRIKKCMDELTDEQIWQRSNNASNSIANIILHLCGNISQYAISSLSSATDQRERDLEFSVISGLNKNELFHKLNDTVENAIRIIKNLDEDELMRLRKVQGFELTGIGIIIHVTEHFSYHTGQIAFYTKQLKNKDLGFYSGIDLNTKNKI